jgi:DNA polymerase II small subunit
VDIVRKFLDRGILLDPEVLDRISSMSKDDIDELVKDLASRGVGLVNSNSLEGETSNETGDAIRAPEAHLELRTEPFAIGSDSRIDYLKHFQNRFDRIASIIRSKNGYEKIPSIIEVKSGPSRSLATIGMICGKDAGGRVLEIEDGTGKIGLVPLGDEVRKSTSQLLLDEVVGVKGKYDEGSGNIEVDGVDFPDIEEQNTQLSSDRIYTAFISDLHFGSEDFMRDAFDRFVDFLNGKHEDRDIGNIGTQTKIVVICGDLVHGDGDDTMESYAGLSRLLAKVPQDTIIFAIPGENDTAGILEPQTGFLEDVVRVFSGLENFRTGSNPCFVNLNTVPVLLYHGRSLDDWGRDLKESGACSLMREMLVRRHLAPTYGLSVPLSPGTNDPFIIGEVPRIFHTGHLHESCLSEYKGVSLLATPSWMASEVSKGAGTVAVVDLSKLEVRQLSFAP